MHQNERLKRVVYLTSLLRRVRAKEPANRFVLSVHMRYWRKPGRMSPRIVDILEAIDKKISNDPLKARTTEGFVAANPGRLKKYPPGPKPKFNEGWF